MSGKRVKIARNSIRKEEWTALVDHPEGWEWAIAALLGVSERWVRRELRRQGIAHPPRDPVPTPVLHGKNTVWSGLI